VTVDLSTHSAGGITKKDLIWPHYSKASRNNFHRLLLAMACGELHFARFPLHGARQHRSDHSRRSDSGAVERRPAGKIVFAGVWRPRTGACAQAATLDTITMSLH
jgi:hypothetical protein